MSNIDFSALLPMNIDSVIEGWLHDDMPSFDVGGLVVGCEEKKAQLFMKSSGVLAGKVFVQKVFHILGCVLEWHKDVAMEGDFVNVPAKICIATVTGPVHQLLRGERTALNILSRCSGVATLSREASDRAKSLGEWLGCWNT